MSRWGERDDVPRGADYDARWTAMAAAGTSVHGEADLVTELLRELGTATTPRVLDAGCGTGRVAVELARRGMDVVGVDLDPGMLVAAREKAPHLRWVEADLAHFDLGPAPDARFDAVVMAGNVLIFVHPGAERAVVANCARHLRPGGLLICGFQVRPGAYDPDRLDADASAAGLTLAERFSTWDAGAWPGDGTYQVSVHAAAPLTEPR